MKIFCCSRLSLWEKAMVRRLRTNASLSEPASFSLNKNLVFAMLYAMVSRQGVWASRSHELYRREFKTSNTCWLTSSDQHASETDLPQKASLIQPCCSTSPSHNSPIDTDGRKSETSCQTAPGALPMSTLIDQFRFQVIGKKRFNAISGFSSVVNLSSWPLQTWRLSRRSRRNLN